MPAPSRFEMDRSLFPLVVSTLPVHPTAEDLDAMMREVNAVLEQRRKFVHVIDCRHQRSAADAVERRKLVAWVRDPCLRELSKYKLVDVVLIESAIVRGAITAVTWIVPPASPIVTVEKLPDAESAIRMHVNTASIDLSDAAWRRIRAG